MTIVAHQTDAGVVAEVISRPDGHGSDAGHNARGVIRSASEALDLFATAQSETGSKRIVIHASTLDSGFFDLRTGLAGEILQKVSNYGLRLAVVGEFQGAASGPLRDFIRESNRYGQVVFVDSVDEAVNRLAR